jgi:hypothetical protein
VCGAVKSGVPVVLKHERAHCHQQVRVTTNLGSEMTGVQSNLQGSVQKSILSGSTSVGLWALEPPRCGRRVGERWALEPAHCGKSFGERWTAFCFVAITECLLLSISLVRVFWSVWFVRFCARLCSMAYDGNVGSGKNRLFIRLRSS